MDNIDQIVKFIFETAVVKRMERTGWQIFGGHRETVGEHTFVTAAISYVVGKKMGADLLPILTMAVFHDFHEARTGEVDKIATFYIKRDQDKANDDIFGTLDPELKKTLDTYEEKQTLEARIVYEVNVLAFGIELKLLHEQGHRKAETWYKGNIARIKIPEIHALAEKLWETDSEVWWKSIQEELHAQFAK
jgi:putative hydrolases of HD superfamily